MKIDLYTDGACSNNPGPGGYGSVLIVGGQPKEFSAGYRRSTNNRMELMGVIAPLRTLEQSCQIEIVSDSKYVIDALSKGWIEKWKRRRWQTSSSKRLVVSQDLWMELDQLVSRHQARYRWIKGHTGGTDFDSLMNHRCDILATKAAAEPTLVDVAYENINLPMSLEPPPSILPVQLSWAEHEALVQSELVWDDAESKID